MKKRIDFLAIMIVLCAAVGIGIITAIILYGVQFIAELVG